MFLLRLLASVPLSVWYGLAPFVAWLVHRVIRYRANLVRDNLQRALPDRSPAEIREIERNFYRYVVEVAFEALCASRMSADELLDRVEVTNPEVFEPYRQSGQSVLLVGAHQANFEWFLLVCSLRLPIPLEVIYRPLHDSWFERFSAESRTRFDARMIPDRDAIKDIMAHHKTQRAVSMAADQRPARKEPRFWTHFLNQDTAFHTGWAKIAQFTRYPVWYPHCERVGRGRYRITFRPVAEPPYARKVDDLVEAYARVLEASILEDPAVWLWSHKRWREPKPMYE